MDNDIDQKVKPVSEYINNLTKVLPNEFENVSDDDFRNGIEKIINQEDFLSRNELVADLARTVTKKEEITPEVELSALKTVLSINNWQENNINETRKYRASRFEENFVKVTQEKNPNLTEDKLESIKRKAKLISRVNGRIENQKGLAIISDNQESIGKRQNSWSDLNTITGFLEMKKKDINNIVLKNKEISAELEGIDLPYESFANLRSFDKIMASEEVLNDLKSSSNRFSLVDKSIMKVKEFTGRDNGLIQIKNGFVSKIGNQATGTFVKNSMNTLLQNGFNAGIKTIVGGLKNTGIKASIGIGATAGTVSGPVGWAITGAAFLKKTFGKLVDKLGIGSKKFIEDNFGKIGGGLIKGLNAVVALPAVLVGLIGITVITPIIIGVILVIFGLQLIQTNGNISSLVPRLEAGENDGGGESGGGSNNKEITYTTDGRIRDCGVGMDENFKSNRKKTWVTAGLLAAGNYDEQLEETIGDQFGQRCGVVYAAQYLAYDFEYFVPYYWNGKYYKKGMDPTWGELKYDDNPLSSKHGTTHPWGLDCSGFVIWSQINGFGSKTGASDAVAFANGRNCERIKAIIEPGDTITLGSGKTYHVAMVLGYDDQYIKFGHSGGGSGSSTGIIDICTGKHRDSSMQFEYLHKKIY